MILLRVVLVTVLLCAGPTLAWAGQPTDDLKSYVDRVVTILEDPAMKGPGRAAERQHAVEAVAKDGLDLHEAARRTLAQYWDARTPAEQARFIDLFTGLIYGSYLIRVSQYSGERVAFDGESVNGNEAVVKARVIATDGDVIPVEFRLVRNGADRWKVWDAAFEGMSLVGNYRAQFTRIIRTASFADLVKRLESRPQPTR
jgi:phospholipid transport system substrate-binding protein